MAEVFYLFQNMLPPWFVTWQPIFFAIGIFLFFLLLRKIFAKYIFHLILGLTKKTKTELDTYILLAFEKPLRVLFVIIGLYISLNYLTGYLSLKPVYETILLRVFRSSIIILLAWGIFNLTNSSSLLIEKLRERYNFQIDKLLIPFVTKFLRFVVVALAISIVAQEWEYDVNGLVAGLGLGGLAFALAAKDTVGNIFGGIVIITEKPFSLGDWIETPSVEGTVEDITFRSTRIRTFAQALVTIPNSTLANEPVTNWSRMGKRRITFNLGISRDTPRSRIENVVNKIRGMLENHPEIHKETIFVRFDQFSESSLEIFLYFFTNTTNWGEWLRVKEDCNLEILRILENEGVSLAFPSRSIYFQTPKEKMKVSEKD